MVSACVACGVVALGVGSAQARAACFRGRGFHGHGTHATAAAAAAAGVRSQRPSMSVFPEEPGAAPTPPPAAPARLSRESAIGFWTIYDDLAAEDALNDMAAGDNFKSTLSSSIVLRADGQTSRGSAFPGGEWTLEQGPMGGAEGASLRWRLRMRLRSQLLREELRYDGLLFGLQSMELPPPGRGAAAGAEAVAAALSANQGSQGSASDEIELRIVGNASRWDIKDEGAPQMVGECRAFSMLKKNVDRRKLTPTIKPWTAPIDPEDVRIQQEWRRLRDREEEDDLRQAIDDVRQAKEADGDGWLERMRVCVQGSTSRNTGPRLPPRTPVTSWALPPGPFLPPRLPPRLTTPPPTSGVRALTTGR